MAAAVRFNDIEICVNGLPQRQAEALAYTVRGLNSKQTAKIMQISSRTVETHLNLAMAPLGAENRYHLIALAVATGLVTIKRVSRAAALGIAITFSIIAPVESTDDYGRLAQRSLRVRTRRTQQRDSLDYLFADA